MHPTRPTAYAWLKQILSGPPTDGPCYHGHIFSARAMEDGFRPQATIEAMEAICNGVGWRFEADLVPVEQPYDMPRWHVRVWPIANGAHLELDNTME